MDALQMLEQDHEKVKRILEELDSTTERALKTREEGLATLKQELTVHELIEEEIFYPALKEHAEAKETVLEAYEEHDVVDAILGELEQTPVDHETWHAKFTVAKENLEHHIEEEEGEMFGQARELLEKDELTTLGEQMLRRKEQAQAERAG
ncbi:MAG TPA: hemerythrin domain-containing protein [Actinomycetota bacterium]|nr:hemerythrin domain-containing protein [Actinomycetota bacterium]